MSSLRARELEEQEVDLATGWERVKLRWYHPIAGLVVGALLGIVLALAGGNVWRADTLVYLGQPFAPLGGGQIQSLATNPRTVSEIVRSEAVLEDVSRETGLPVSKLRSSISTKEIIAPGQPRAGVTPLIVIGVKGDDGPRRIEDAADGLAQRGVDDVSGSVQQPVERLPRQVEVSQGQLDAVEARIRTAQQQQSRILQDDSVPVDLRAILSLNLNSVITTADARRTALQDDLFEAEQLLILAEQVEKSRIVEPAAAVKTTARSSRTSLAVGALLGLLAGALAALVAEPVLARRRRSSP